MSGWVRGSLRGGTGVWSHSIWKKGGREETDWRRKRAGETHCGGDSTWHRPKEQSRGSKSRKETRSQGEKNKLLGHSSHAKSVDQSELSKLRRKGRGLELWNPPEWTNPYSCKRFHVDYFLEGGAMSQQTGTRGSAWIAFLVFIAQSRSVPSWQCTNPASPFRIKIGLDWPCFARKK